MSDFSASNLYCCEDAGDVSYWSADDGWTPSPSPKTTYLSSDIDDRWISTFLESELHHMPASDYIRRFRDHSLDVNARQDAVNWILKVHEYYHFSPVTAALSVNYLDRFLSTHTLPRGNGWPFQLLSVACLSVAAKMEETYIPLLVDFQLFESRFVFESRTIRRMELLVMAKLRWRMRAVTPFDFLDHFARMLGSHPLLVRASNLILRTLRVIDFLEYRPSTIAASAVLCAAEEITDISVKYDYPAIFCEWLSKEMVSRCQELMREFLIHTRQKAAPEPAPRSPVGVLDAAACGSCDTQKSDSNEPVASRAERSAQPATKMYRYERP